MTGSSHQIESCKTGSASGSTTLEAVFSKDEITRSALIGNSIELKLTIALRTNELSSIGRADITSNRAFYTYIIDQSISLNTVSAKISTVTALTSQTVLWASDAIPSIQR